jgi:glycerol kinase
MRVATQNLIILDIEPNDIVAVGITNQRETSLLWNSRSGEVFNTLSNTESPKINLVVDRFMQRTKNKKNYLRAVCGLPFDV